MRPVAVRVIVLAILLLVAACSNQVPFVCGYESPSYLEVEGPGFSGVIVPASLASPYQGLSPHSLSWTPSRADVVALEAGLAEALVSSGVRSRIRDQLDTYRRQYVGIGGRDRKVIFVNAFPGVAQGEKDRFSRWKELPVVGVDGGHHFWRIMFDVETQEYFSFEQNGYV